MIVPWHDPSEMWHVHDFESQPNFLSGGINYYQNVEGDRLLNPRAVGFGREDAFYIPVYLSESE